jgi:hypothetical protein
LPPQDSVSKSPKKGQADKEEKAASSPSKSKWFGKKDKKGKESPTDTKN